MSQYRDGTVTVTNGDATIVGAGTAFVANVAAGDLLTLLGSGVFYEVASVTNDTHLELTANYAGSTLTGQDFIVCTGFTPNFNIPEISGGDLNWPDVLTRALRLIDVLLASLRTAAGALTPATLADSAATNNSLFVGSDHSSKLCWKDGSGAVHVLY
jgi:hypothetical protein